MARNICEAYPSGNALALRCTGRRARPGPGIAAAMSVAVGAGGEQRGVADRRARGPRRDHLAGVAGRRRGTATMVLGRRCDSSLHRR